MEKFMNNLKRAIILLTLVLALLFSVAAPVLATDDVEPPVDDTTGETTTPEEGEEGTEPDEKDNALADALAAIEAKTPLKQYDLPVVNGPYTWEPDKAESTNWKWGGNTATGSWGQILNRLEGINDIGLEEVEEGNYAFTVRYNGELEKQYEAENGDVHSYAYYSVGSHNKDNNLVIEFDIACFGDKYPVMAIEHANVTNDAGGRSQPKMFDITAEGRIIPSYTGNRSKSGYTLTAEEQERINNVQLTFGEWTHISIIYETKTCFISLYVNYEFIARFDTRPSTVSYYDLSVFRFGTPNTIFCSGEFSLDNYIAYEGSYIRTPDLFEKMSEPEKFMFYSNYLLNADASVEDRVTAYKYATNLVEEYYEDDIFNPYEDDSLSAEELADLNARLEAAVIGYYDFANAEDGYAKLYVEYITDNLLTFEKYVDEYKDTQVRTLASVGDRTNAIDNIKLFLTNCGDDILQTPDSIYVQVKGEFDRLVGELDNDKKITTFINAVDRFYKSVSFSAETLQKHYKTASEVYMTIYDRSVAELEGFEAFAEALDRYTGAADLLESKLRDRNSKTIIDCIGFISGYTTKEEWNANYEYINRYVVIVRDVVREDRYNAASVGLAEALDFFYLVDEHFYGLLQEEHGAYIAGLLETYRDTDSYVEKSGICAHLDAYIASVDIDLNHKAVKDYVFTLQIYKDELKTYEEDYKEVLAQNTLMFKNKISLMITAEGYAELRRLYNEARELYFAMNIGDENIAEELAFYDEMTFYLAAIEKASADFVYAVDILRAATTKEEKYAALVQCYISAADADEDVVGVADAMAYYLAEYEAYNSGIDTTIAEINTAVKVSVAPVRATSGVREIVAVIVKKITGEQ